jgi:hypothetical protein
MARSVSYLMSYSRKTSVTCDCVGGLPSHLPYQWPRCQMCQSRMGFVGQLYAADWFPIQGHLALQFYACNDCRRTVPLDSASRRAKKAAVSVAITHHMEALPNTASPNVRNEGVRCKFQPRRYIHYLPVEDSMDQSTFNRQKVVETDLPDKHLREDKIGGLFPYDGYEGPKITKRNQMIAQFKWQGIGGTIYLYQSSESGIYPYLYF